MTINGNTDIGAVDRMLAIQDDEEFLDQEHLSFNHELTRLTFLLTRMEVLPPDRIPSALSQLATLQASAAAAQATLISRMVSSPSNGNANETGSSERWLTADQAAELLQVERKWLYRRAKTLPFTRRLSRKKLLFSESGLRRWIATRKP